MEDAVEEKLEIDIKREFQLERMVLFSDAVFAIVITLLAIEIKIPESEKKYSSDELLHHVKLLVPTILAYASSFIVIGIVWYKHLQIFARLKDYDKGLVIRNLALLFCIGLFPFGASMVSHPNNIILPYIVYFIVVFMCNIAQVTLHYYIFYQNPALLHTPPTNVERLKVKTALILISTLGISATIAGILFVLIDNPEYKPFALFIVLSVPLLRRYLDRKNKLKQD